MACLALFTYLTTGLKAACTVYSQVLALVPEATQRESAVCEALTVRQVALMQAAAFRGWGAGGVVGEGASKSHTIGEAQPLFRKERMVFCRVNQCM